MKYIERVNNIYAVNIIFSVMLIVSVFGYIFQSLSNFEGVSFTAQTLIFMNALAFLICILQYTNITKNSYKVTLICLIFLSCLISYLTSSDKLPMYDFYLKVIGYMSMILPLFYLDYLKIDIKYVKFIISINVIIAIYFIYMSLGEYAYLGHPTALTLGYSNSNQAGIYIFYVNIAILIGRSFYKNKLPKVFFISLVIYLTYLLFKTESRTTFILMMFMIFYSLFMKRITIKKWVVVLITLIPVLFMSVYTGLYNNGQLLNFEIMGKPFYSGRQILFINVLNDLKGNMLLGRFGKYFFLNTHNGILSILATTGILGVIFYYIYIWGVLLNINKQASNNNVSQIAYISMLVFYINASTESAILVSGFLYGISFSTMYILSKVKEE